MKDAGLKIKCNCNSIFIKKKFLYFSKPKDEKPFKINGPYSREFNECTKCKHMFAKHNFSINKVYSKEYLNLVYKDEFGIEKRFNYINNLPISLSDNKKRALRIHNFFLKKKRLKLMDVGSGIGLFMNEMKKKNWSVSGIELDDRYVDYCKKKHNLKVRNISLNLLPNINKFDLITFNKVLEHLKSPYKLLKQAVLRLKKNGIIYVEVPHTAATKKGKYRQEFGLEHFHVFSKISLSNMISKSGLAVIDIKSILEPSGKYTIFVFARKKI